MRIARQLGLALAASICVTSCGGGGGSSSTPATVSGGATTTTSGIAALKVMPEVDSVNGVADITLQAKFDAAGRPEFFYNGAEAVPAPTIRVNPGDTINFHFQNSLPEYCDPGVESDSNLHFHGLTSAPVAPGDEVIQTIAQPGATVNYSVVINTDQPPGMYWYHPHPHGLSSYEVGNGMAGAIIIEGIASEVPQTAGLRERIIVLGAQPNDPSFSAGEDARRRHQQAVRRANDNDEGLGSCAADPDTTTMINGAPLASIGINNGETELIRVVNASGHRFFDLSVDGKTLTLVAQDGVPIHDYAGAPTTLTQNDIVIPPAGRAEFLVTGGASPAAFTSKCYATGPAGDPAPEAVLGVFAPDNATTSSNMRVAHRIAAAGVLRHSKFYRVAMPAPAQERTIHFTEDPNGFYLDGQAYDPTAGPHIVAQSGTVEEWTLENDTDEVHDFHIHQVHFAVETIAGVAQANPHWLDDITLPPQGHGASGQVIPSITKVLIDFRDPIIKGTFLYHCHILDHEDGGMMAKIQVI
jgi:FtsP/CotA-like multicopper oxidase with cupredoxin domain